MSNDSGEEKELNLVRFAHNWNDGMLEYWALSEALAL
jgi:hypothetical protein